MVRVLRSILVIVLPICFLVSCASTPALVYKHPEFESYKFARPAVLPFKDALGHAGSGEIVAQIFETTLLATGKFEVIERGQINRILEEQDISLSGLIEDPVSIGKMVKADVVVVGSITTWKKGSIRRGNTTVGASIKAVLVETGVILWSIDKSTQATYFTDGLPIDSPCDMVAKKLCREMVKAFIEK